jgi:hypothetical protein
MKWIIGLVLVLAVIGGGYFYLTMNSTAGKADQTTEQSNGKTAPRTVQGTLTKVQNPKDDYTHMLTTSSGLVKLNSYSVTLDDYVGKKVEVTGQNSGTTLFADTVTVIQ